MKKWKKHLSVLLAVTLLFGVMSVSAFGVNFTTNADILKEMQLFQGTPAGYELARVPTRVEAATMLVRLLGVESEANKGTYTHAFTDVPDWAKNTMGYLYEKGLAKGVTPTTYNSQAPCQAIMYLTFILRSLGYDDAKGDFDYKTAIEAAVKYDVIDIGMAQYYRSTKDFLRDDLVGISYCALSAKIKGKNQTLLDKLVADKAVTKELADKYREKLDGYALYRTVISKTRTYSNYTGIIKKDIIRPRDSDSNTETSLKVVNGNNIKKMQAEIIRWDRSEGRKEVRKEYCKDGWMYRDMTGEGYDKVKYVMESPISYDLGFDPADPVAGVMPTLSYPPQVISYSKLGNGFKLVIKIKADQMEQFTFPHFYLSNSLNAGTWKSEEDCEATYTVDAVGRVTSAVFAAVYIDPYVEDSGQMDTYKYDITMTYPDKAPTITVPNLSGYEDVSGQSGA